MARLQFRDVLAVVAHDAGFVPATLAGRERTPEVDAARGRAIMLARCLDPERMTVTRIGFQLDNRVSGTIVHAHQVAEARYREDPAERERCARLAGVLGFERLPAFTWSAKAHRGLDNLDRLIEATEARLERLRQRRAFLTERA